MTALLPQTDRASSGRMRTAAAARPRRGVTPPHDVRTVDVRDLLPPSRPLSQLQQQRLGLGGDDGRPVTVYAAGDLSLLQMPCVAVVGSRKVSQNGVLRAARLGRELARAGVVVVSGLAMGVDIAAHRATMEAGGRTIAILGTPFDRANPTSHAETQARIAAEHLAITQFALGSEVYPSNFPQRNKLMAAVTDATVIIEASDTSGTLHQAAECTRLGRWLFIARSVFDDPKLTWPASFKKYERCRPLDSTADIVSAIAG